MIVVYYNNVYALRIVKDNYVGFNMINIRCSLPTTLTIKELEPFQGALKVRTPDDLSQLSNSLKTEGLIMPFVVWNSESGMKLLDGHGRLEALRSMCASDAEITTQQFPVIYIDAQTEDEAKKLLLQVTSSYGKISKKGALEFCKSIPEYHAPSINKFVYQCKKHRKLEAPKTETLIRISVPSDKVEEVKKILASVSFIKVL